MQLPQLSAQQGHFKGVANIDQLKIVIYQPEITIHLRGILLRYSLDLIQSHLYQFLGQVSTVRVFQEAQVFSENGRVIADEFGVFRAGPQVHLNKFSSALCYPFILSKAMKLKKLRNEQIMQIFNFDLVDSLFKFFGLSQEQVLRKSQKGFQIIKFLVLQYLNLRISLEPISGARLELVLNYLFKKLHPFLQIIILYDLWKNIQSCSFPEVLSRPDEFFKGQVVDSPIVLYQETTLVSHLSELAVNALKQSLFVMLNRKVLKLFQLFQLFLCSIPMTLCFKEVYCLVNLYQETYWF